MHSAKHPSLPCAHCSQLCVFHSQSQLCVLCRSQLCAAPERQELANLVLLLNGNGVALRLQKWYGLAQK